MVIVTLVFTSSSGFNLYFYNEHHVIVNFCTATAITVSRSHVIDLQCECATTPTGDLLDVKPGEWTLGLKNPNLEQNPFPVLTT